MPLLLLFSFFVGLYFNNQAQKKINPQTTPETASPPQIDYDQIKKVGLTQREHDVLVKMAEGLSNQEIAQHLFLSESTVKTHVSNILFKLDAKRRTQAVQAAKKAENRILIFEVVLISNQRMSYFLLSDEVKSYYPL